MPRRRSPWTETLTRTVLRLLAVAGLLAMLPSLPQPGPARGAAARTAVASAVAGR